VISAASLVFHELVPGHHLHLTLQAANDDLPPVRRWVQVGLPLPALEWHLDTVFGS
jgi:hypothetical protein